MSGEITEKSTTFWVCFCPFSGRPCMRERNTELAIPTPLKTFSVALLY